MRHMYVLIRPKTVKICCASAFVKQTKYLAGTDGAWNAGGKVSCKRSCGTAEATAPRPCDLQVLASTQTRPSTSMVPTNCN